MGVRDTLCMLEIFLINSLKGSQATGFYVINSFPTMFPVRLTGGLLHIPLPNLHSNQVGQEKKTHILKQFIKKQGSYQSYLHSTPQPDPSKAGICSCGLQLGSEFPSLRKKTSSQQRTEESQEPYQAREGWVLVCGFCCCFLEEM